MCWPAPWAAPCCCLLATSTSQNLSALARLHLCRLYIDGRLAGEIRGNQTLYSPDGTPLQVGYLSYTIGVRVSFGVLRVPPSRRGPKEGLQSKQARALHCSVALNSALLPGWCALPHSRSCVARDERDQALHRL